MMSLNNAVFCSKSSSRPVPRCHRGCLTERGRILGTPQMDRLLFRKRIRHIHILRYRSPWIRLCTMKRQWCVMKTHKSVSPTNIPLGLRPRLINRGYPSPNWLTDKYILYSIRQRRGIHEWSPHAHQFLARTLQLTGTFFLYLNSHIYSDSFCFSGRKGLI